MSTYMRVVIKSLTFSHLALLAVTAQALTCTEVWNATSAALTCVLTVNPIPESSTGTGMQPFQNCEIHARCRTGRTVPEDPNSWNSREITEYKNVNSVIYIDYMKGLKNCQGSLC